MTIVIAKLVYHDGNIASFIFNNFASFIFCLSFSFSNS